MNLERLETRLSFALVFIAIVAHCIAQHALGLVLVAGALAIGSRYVCDGPRGLTLPRSVSLLFTAFALTISMVGLLADPSRAMAWVGTFVVWLTVIKLYERRSVENEAERLILSLLLMVLAGLSSIDLLFGILLVAWTGLGVAVLLLFQLYHGQELVRMEQRAVAIGDVLPASVSRPVCGLGVRRAFRRMVALVFAIMLIFSGLFFMGFPRSWTGGLARAATGRSGPATSGYAARVELAGITRINESLAEVLSVELVDVAGASVQLEGPLRLRGATLDRYRGNGVWEPSGQAMADWRNEIDAGTWHSLQTARSFELASDRLLTQRFDMATPLDSLFSMSVPLEIRTPVSSQLEYNSYTQVLAVVGEVAPLQYEIRALPGPTGGLPSALTWERYRSDAVRNEAVRLLSEAGLPERRPRTPAEAMEWNIAAATVFSNHLSRSGFSYTLDMSRLARGVGDERDPVERFLLEDRIGHCEFFAAGLVGLCQSVDINARIVMGVVSDRFDEFTRRYVVLEADAHAWVEVESSPGDWLTLEPTPTAFTPEGRQEVAGVAQRLQWLYRWVEGGWRTSILGFDEGSQEKAVRQWLPWWSALASKSVQWMEDTLVTVNLAFGFGGAGYIWMGVVVLLVSMAVFIWRRTIIRRRRVLVRVACPEATGRVARRLERELGFYAIMLDRLAAQGVPKPDWQPPCAFADAIEAHKPATAACIRALARRFYSIRFGDHLEDADTASEQLEQLSSALEYER
jgi:heme exporter protein D